MPEKKPKNKVPPKFIKVPIYWVLDEEGNYIFDEDEIFNEYTMAISKIMEEYTEPNEIEFEDEVGEDGEC